jgi:hypothetical protein
MMGLVIVVRDNRGYFFVANKEGTERNKIFGLLETITLLILF